MTLPFSKGVKFGYISSRTMRCLGGALRYVLFLRLKLQITTI